MRNRNSRIMRGLLRFFLFRRHLFQRILAALKDQGIKGDMVALCHAV